MAHNQQRVFINQLKEKYQDFFKQKKVLDIGSLDINGSMRDFFENCEYTGIDVGEGPGVDIVCQGQDYNAANESYDVVCSSECFEHNPFWFETFENMIRMCKRGGLVFFTCATDGRPEHGTSRTTPDCSPLTVNLGWSYYQNLNEIHFKDKIDFDEYFSIYDFSVNLETYDLYFWGIKKDSIPIIGTAIVNNPYWVHRLIFSVDYPVDEFVIFNNNGRGEIDDELDSLRNMTHKYIKKITVCHLPSNIGCSGAWNMIIKCYMQCPYWIITNHDIAFTPGFLKEMHNKSKNNEIGLVYGGLNEYGIGKFDLFLIKDWIVQKYGLFDENFYPGYCEDFDYHMRLLNEPVKQDSVNLPYYHGEVDYASTGSQTWRSDISLKEKIDKARILNENEYMEKKWGDGWHWFKPFIAPFNNASLPLSYITYDLNFLRKKHLGF